MSAEVQLSVGSEGSDSFASALGAKFGWAGDLVCEAVCLIIIVISD